MRVLPCSVCAEEGPCEDIGRGQQSASWESLFQKSNQPEP